MGYGFDQYIPHVNVEHKKEVREGILSDSLFLHKLSQIGIRQEFTGPE